MSTLPSYTVALSSALSIVQKVSITEQVSLDFSVGRVSAGDIVADRDLPPYNRSQMDGYAVVASEITKGKQLKVLGQVAAGTTFEGEYLPNSCVAIATGAPVPDCFDAVVQHEQTDNGTEVVKFQCSDVPKGNAIHLRGADAKSGDVLVPKQTQLKPQHIGIAASVGCSCIDVLSKPKVIILTSGDEVVSPNEKPLPHQIRNGNNPMVSTAFTSMGCDVVETHHLPDDLDETKRAMEKALDGRCDLVVTVGGISAGTRDFFPDAFKHSDVELVVKGANIQPGKPIIVGKHENAVILGLPGNPVSALACGCVFGWPIVKWLLGCHTSLPWQTIRLGSPVKPNPHRTAFRPCSITGGTINIPTWQGSGDLTHAVHTTGLAQLSPSDDEFEAGFQVSYLAYPWC